LRDAGDAKLGLRHHVIGEGALTARSAASNLSPQSGLILSNQQGAHSPPGGPPRNLGRTAMSDIHVISGPGHTLPHPGIRTIEVSDLKDALARGYSDLAAFPSYPIFLCLIYPIVGFALGGLAFGKNMLPLIYPLAAGFALIGPIAALGLYEMSRRREAGGEPDVTHAFDVVRSPSMPAILAVSALLVALFVAWIATAQALYTAIMGPVWPDDPVVFIRNIVTTREGWMLIFLGNMIGAVFAVVAFALSVISFPLLLDRDVGALAAIETSLRAVAANSGPMTVWGLIVAALLLLGSIPFFIGLAVVMPLLGHATWHLYRKVVER
jgi:uncharacterized membrane protein